MLVCQWKKRTGEEQDCDNCVIRFECHTIIARKFHITESRLVYDIFEIYAENKGEAEEIASDYSGSDMAPKVESDGAEDGYVTIEEIDEDDRVMAEIDEIVK